MSFTNHLRQRANSIWEAQYTHPFVVALGKGTGIKAPDFYIAWLCQECHSLYDGRTGRLTKDECDELWTRAYLRTVREWFEQGIVVVK